MHHLIYAIIPHNIKQDVYEALTPLFLPHYRDSDNPDGMWDALQIGGRWTGVFDSLYEPPKHLGFGKGCQYCTGYGNRPDPITRKFHKEKQRIGCPMCQKYKKSIEQPVEWIFYKGDIVPIEKLLSLRNGEFMPPTAVVTPQQEWIDLQKLLKIQSAFAYNEREANNIRMEVKKIMRAYKNHLVVVVDCHN